MAVLGNNEVEEVQVENAPVTAVAKEAEVVVPENVETLSSGVQVQFLGSLPSYLAQELVVSAFTDTNIGADGRVREDMNNGEQLRIAKKLYDYNAALILHGLNEGVLKIWGGLPANKRWLSMVKLNPMVKATHEYIDFEDQLHLEFLFLFYIGFREDTDWQLLSARLLNR